MPELIFVVTHYGLYIIFHYLKELHVNLLYRHKMLLIYICIILLLLLLKCVTRKYDIVLKRYIMFIYISYVIYTKKIEIVLVFIALMILLRDINLSCD